MGGHLIINEMDVQIIADHIAKHQSLIAESINGSWKTRAPVGENTGTEHEYIRRVRAYAQAQRDITELKGSMNLLFDYGLFLMDKKLESLNQPEEKMLYEVAILTINKDGKATGIALPITAVIADDHDSAIVAATTKLGAEGTVVDPTGIRVLVRKFQG